MQSFVGNEHTPFTIAPSAGRTDFQTNYIISVAKRPDFDFFCCDPTCDEPYRGSFLLIFFTKDDKMHVIHVGQRRIIKPLHPGV